MENGLYTLHAVHRSEAIFIPDWGIVYITPLSQYRNKQYGHLFEVCVSAQVALRMLLSLSQPVNCILWPIKTLN